MAEYFIIISIDGIYVLCGNRETSQFAKYNVVLSYFQTKFSWLKAYRDAMAAKHESRYVTAIDNSM